MPSSNCPISPKAERAVTFAATARRCLVLHINDFSQAEIQACWYKDEELGQVREDMIRTLHLVEEGHVEKNGNDKFCPRGLEFLSPQGAKRRLQNRKLSHEVVLTEQKRQRQQGIHVPEFIAQVYAYTSHHCQTAAQRLALEDEQFAVMELEEVKNLMASYRKIVAFGRCTPRRFSNATTSQSLPCINFHQHDR